MRFRIGDKVIDRDGFHGIVTNIHVWEGVKWYEVCLFDGARLRGEVVRYDSDLSKRE